MVSQTILKAALFILVPQNSERPKIPKQLLTTFFLLFHVVSSQWRSQVCGGRS